jgi:hypothetical protein
MKNRILHQTPGGTLDLATRRSILASTLRILRQQSRQLARDYLRWYAKVVGQ